MSLLLAVKDNLGIWFVQGKEPDLKLLNLKIYYVGNFQVEGCFTLNLYIQYIVSE